MWSELAAAFGGIGAMGLILRFQQNRINKIQDQKMDRRACDAQISQFTKDMDKGTKRFDKIDDKLESHAAALGVVSTDVALIRQSVEFIAKQNGYSPK